MPYTPLSFETGNPYTLFKKNLENSAKRVKVSVNTVLWVRNYLKVNGINLISRAIYFRVKEKLFVKNGTGKTNAKDFFKKTISEQREEKGLRQALQSAVNKETAPEKLRQKIREMIRK